jgi:hypothetical protein
MYALLAVDLGLRTGLALYGRDGRLISYRSRNFGTATRLRRRVHSLLDELPALSRIVLEGGGPLAKIWEHEALRREIIVRQISAETWRRRLLYPREQRNGPQAKLNAADMARRVIEWSDAPRPTSLRHDAAEAILIGLWGVLEAGWLKRLPPGMRCCPD